MCDAKSGGSFMDHTDLNNDVLVSSTSGENWFG